MEGSFAMNREAVNGSLCHNGRTMSTHSPTVGSPLHSNSMTPDIDEHETSVVREGEEEGVREGTGGTGATGATGATG